MVESRCACMRYLTASVSQEPVVAVADVVVVAVGVLYMCNVTAYGPL